MTTPVSLYVALLTTVVIEGAVMLALTRNWNWVRQNLYCNLVTNPLLNLTLVLLRPAQFRWLLIAVLELAVLFGEAGLYRAMSGTRFRRCLLYSFVTNAASFAAGFLIF